MSTSTTIGPSIATDTARSFAGATDAALRALQLPYLVLGRDGRIGDADLSPYNLATAIKPGAPLDSVLSIPVETLIDAARFDRPKPLPALLYTATTPTLVLAQPVRSADALVILILSLDALQDAEKQKFEQI